MLLYEVIFQIKKATEYTHIVKEKEKTLSPPKGSHCCPLVSPELPCAHIPGMCTYVSLSLNVLDEPTPKTCKLTLI